MNLLDKQKDITKQMIDLFQKQRRNLLLFSSLILFVNLAGAKISQINILGNVVSINNPRVVSVALFLALIYFSVRYLQYMHAIKDKGFVESFQWKAKEYISPYLVNRLFKTHFGGPGKIFDDVRDVRVHQFIMFGRMEPKKAHIAVTHKTGGVVHEYGDQTFTWKELSVPYLRACLYVCARTHLVSEYVFPLVFTTLSFLSFNPQVAAYIVGSL